MEKLFNILVINPGSTSTKVAFYQNEKVIYEESMDVNRETISEMKDIFDQYNLRRESIDKFAMRNGIDLRSLDVIVSRGGGGGNLMAGGYLIDEAFVEHCHTYEIPHASSLGPVIAYDMGKELNIPAFIYDGEGVNEFGPLAVLSGIKQFPLSPGSHTLNAKAAARLAAKRMGGNMEDYNFIVNHLGGGTSTSAHCKGKLIDSSSDGFSPERGGGMPFQGIINFISECFSGKYTKNEVIRLFMGKGGLMSYLGTSDLREVEKRINAGDEEAKFYFDGMVYQQAKDIGAMATVLNMDVDAIVLTGGMAYSDMLVNALKTRVQKIAPVIVLPGSHEMDSLASGGLRIMLKKEKYHLYGKDAKEDRYIEQ